MKTTTTTARGEQDMDGIETRKQLFHRKHKQCAFIYSRSHGINGCIFFYGDNGGGDHDD